MKKLLFLPVAAALALSLSACDGIAGASSSSGGSKPSLPREVTHATGPEVDQAKACLTATLPEWEKARDEAREVTGESQDWSYLINRWAGNRNIVSNAPGYLTGWTTTESDEIVTHNIDGNGGIGMGIGTVTRDVYHPPTITPGQICDTAAELLGEMRELAGIEGGPVREPGTIVVTVTPSAEPVESSTPTVTVTADPEPGEN